MPLFERKKFTTYAGRLAGWKIECDALTDEDWKTLAYMISEYQNFRGVYGVPTGGTPLAKAHVIPENSKLPFLIVDDVLTTGKSMEEARALIDEDNVIGWVVFSRGITPEWINALFQIKENI